MRGFALAALWIFLLAIDRVTKMMFLDDPALGGSFGIPGILEITGHFNRGLLANLPVPIPVILFLTFIAITVILIAIRQSAQQNQWSAVLGYAILFAGAIGNLWDRLQWGFVFDWLLLGGKSVINAADAWVGIGLCVVIFSSSRSKRLDTASKTR